MSPQVTGVLTALLTLGGFVAVVASAEPLIRLRFRQLARRKAVAARGHLRHLIDTGTVLDRSEFVQHADHLLSAIILSASPDLIREHAIAFTTQFLAEISEPMPEAFEAFVKELTYALMGTYLARPGFFLRCARLRLAGWIATVFEQILPPELRNLVTIHTRHHGPPLL